MKTHALYAGLLATLSLSACGPADRPYHPKPHSDDAYYKSDKPHHAAVGRSDHRHKAEILVDYYFPFIDLNRDGVISRAEHEAYGYKMFREADINRDNVLSYPEVVDQNVREIENMKSADYMPYHRTYSSRQH